MEDQFADGLAASLEDYDAELAAGVLRELREGIQADAVLAMTRQNAIAEATSKIEFAAVDGIGECTMRLDPMLYHYWGSRLGYDCWKDKQFKKEILRDNENARVTRRRQVNPTVAMPSNGTFQPRQAEAKPRFPNQANQTAATAKDRATPTPKPSLGVASNSKPLPVQPAGKIIV